MTQANESLGLTAAEHIRALNRHARAQLFDYALINRRPASDEMKAKYALEGAAQIVADLDAVEQLGCCPVLGDYLEEEGVARHATDIVARDLLDLALQAAGPAAKACLNQIRPGADRDAFASPPFSLPSADVLSALPFKVFFPSRYIEANGQTN